MPSNKLRTSVAGKYAGVTYETNPVTDGVGKDQFGKAFGKN